MNLGNASGVIVRRAAVTSPDADAFVARRGAETLLAAVPDRDAWAVLCLRRVSLHLGRHGRSLPPDSHWLAEEVERLRRTAARPGFGPVPPQAQAVLFRDHSELLACLARDGLAGLLVARWWWHVLLPGADLPGSVESLWIAEAMHVPTALHRLATTGEVLAFVRQLGDAGSRRVADATIRAHGLLGLVTVADGTSTRQRADSRVPPVIVEAKPIHAEVRAALPEVFGKGLSRSQRMLLTAGLALVRMPRVVRTAKFATALPVLLAVAESDGQAAEAAPVRGEGGERHAPSARRVSFEPIPASARPEEATTVHGSPASLPDVAFAGSHPAAGSEGAQGVGRELPRRRTLPQGTPKMSIKGNGDTFTRHDTVERVGTASTGPPLTSTVPSEVPTPCMAVEPVLDDAARAIASRFGGVFFLANLALSLGLYSDFSRPMDPVLDLPFWDFLALAGEGLVEDAGTDPVWQLLAELSGRTPGEPAGSGRRAPDAWRMPAEWCEPFRNFRRPWRWRSRHGRLQVLHGAGFVVVDVARHGRSVARQLAAELAPYRACGFSRLVRDGDLQMPALDGWAHWRAWLMPYLKRRLALALGTGSAAALRRMLRLSARVVIRTGRVEVRMHLSDLPIAVRLAGLDRNTGWIPAAGRSVDFIFGVEDVAEH